MWHQTQDCDAVVAWFASWHSLPAFVAAALRGIPRILITGGYDVAKEPEINYGLQLGGMPRWISNAVFRLATIALPFSETSYHEALKNTPLNPQKTKLVVLGVPDASQFQEPVPKEKIAFTVSAINAVSVARKGIRTFVEAAKLIPDIQCYVVGKATDDAIDELKQVAPPNVIFTGFMSDADLVDLRKRAKVYVQASIHEGFGLAVAEAMLARCIPVISQRGSLPEVVGDIGIYTDLTPEALAVSVQQASHFAEGLGEQARQRILDNFPLEHRAEQLYSIIDTVTQDKI
jgi:glycosyltransferase involved in cell wall biosynthesis